MDAVTKLSDALAGHNALLTPTTPHAAYAFDGLPSVDQARYTALPSALGWPSTAFPIGAAKSGMPLSAMVTALDDATCLTLAALLAA